MLKTFVIAKQNIYDVCKKYAVPRMHLIMHPLNRREILDFNVTEQYQIVAKNTFDTMLNAISPARVTKDS